MAGILFPFNSLRPLIDLHVGIADRLDDNRAESFTLFYCNFGVLDEHVVESSLEQFLRTSDAYAKQDGHYFFLFPFTDKYGTTTVRGMFEEFFDVALIASEVSYPTDGDNTQELLKELQTQLSSAYQLTLPTID